MDCNRLPRIVSYFAVWFCVGGMVPALAAAPDANDLVQETVEKVSLGQYKSYQIDIQDMGLGLYGGPDYDQGYRGRDGWFEGGSLGNAEARLYLAEQFQAMGLEVAIQGDYVNVVAEWPGMAHPNDVYIVCAHYDSTSGGERPGGDDNASGTAGVLEAARVLTQYHTDATIRFIGFNAEEDWMLGSDDYVVNELMPSGDNVLGVINLDMILRPGWDANPAAPSDVDIATGDLPVCLDWVATFIDIASLYTPSLLIDPNSPGTTYWYPSDQGPFIAAGYPAFMLSEATAGEIWSGDSNAYYHSAEDASDALANDPDSPSGVTYDYDFATDVVRATVATLATQAHLTSRDLPTFVAYQDIPAAGATDLEFFTLDGEAYLAVAREADGGPAPVDSVVYRWDRDGFVAFQDLPTSGAQDCAFFTIAEEAFLAVANATDGVTHRVDSQIFRWDGARFEAFQSLPSQGASDCTFFSIADVHYLAVANAGGDTTTNVNSEIYQWTGQRFDPFQSLPTHAARDWEVFSLAGETFLAVANSSNDQTHNVDSVIYRWTGVNFVTFQRIATRGAADWEFFTVGADAYLAVANAHDDQTSEIDSQVYRWDGAGFVPFQSLPTYGAVAWESFTVGNAAYLAVANAGGGDQTNTAARIYRWNGTRFVESQSIGVSGAQDAAFLTIGESAFLGLPQFPSGEPGPGSVILYQHRQAVPDRGGAPETWTREDLAPKVRKKIIAISSNKGENP